jgi:hypothetical protein
MDEKLFSIQAIHNT